LRSYTYSKFRKSYTPPAARIRVNDSIGPFHLDTVHFSVKAMSPKNIIEQ
jgi:hypothetical protein